MKGSLECVVVYSQIDPIEERVNIKDLEILQQWIISWQKQVQDLRQKSIFQNNFPDQNLRDYTKIAKIDLR